jgi:hypothetical protein
MEFLSVVHPLQIIQEICRNLLIPPVGYLGKCAAHNDYTEEEARRISIAATILVYLEEPIRLPSPHRINFSVRQSVCLFHMKTRKIFM